MWNFIILFKKEEEIDRTHSENKEHNRQNASLEPRKGREWL